MFVNGKEIHKFHTKDSQIVAIPLCLGNISIDWSVVILKKKRLNGYVYDFSVDYNTMAIDDDDDIYIYISIDDVSIDDIYR